MILLVLFSVWSAVSADDPYFDDLASHLPLTLDPSASNQFLFFIVPIQKSEGLNLVVQAAQVQDDSLLRSNDRTFESVEAQDANLNSTSLTGPDLAIGDLFSTDDPDGGEFNFQVPVVVPFNFPFRYDPVGSGTTLPPCDVDSRTWMERIVSQVVETMKLDCPTPYDQSDLTLQIRLLKDTLVSVTEDDLSNSALLSEYMSHITSCKALAAVRTSALLQDLEKLTADYGGLVSEALDTYRTLKRALEMASNVAGALPSDTLVDIAEAQILLLQPQLGMTISQLEDAYELVKELQRQEDEGA